MRFWCDFVRFPKIFRLYRSWIGNRLRPIDCVLHLVGFYLQLLGIISAYRDRHAATQSYHTQPPYQVLLTGQSSSGWKLCAIGNLDACQVSVPLMKPRRAPYKSMAKAEPWPKPEPKHNRRLRIRMCLPPVPNPHHYLKQRISAQNYNLSEIKNKSAFLSHNRQQLSHES